MSGRHASDFSFCPDCKRRGVSFRVHTGSYQGEGFSYYGCRYCGFSFKDDGGEYDQANKQRWKAFQSENKSWR